MASRKQGKKADSVVGKITDSEELKKALAQVQKALGKQKDGGFDLKDGGRRASIEEQEAIKLLQKQLGLKEEYQTGYYGPITKAAIERAQVATQKDDDKRNDLEKDGVAGKNTITHLFSSPIKQIAQTEAKSSANSANIKPGEEQKSPIAAGAPAKPTPKELLDRNFVEDTGINLAKSSKSPVKDKTIAEYLEKFGSTDVEAVRGRENKSGNYLGRFGKRSFIPADGASLHHVGTDFEADYGDKVLAPFAGKITGYAKLESGGRIGLEYDFNNGLTGRDLHVVLSGKKIGDKFKAGEVIGIVANIGPSLGSHLHREFKDPQTGLNINPLVFHDVDKLCAQGQKIACEKVDKKTAKWMGEEELKRNDYAEIKPVNPTQIASSKDFEARKPQPPRK